ncbi:hypothetical protein NQZ71_13260 [Niallia taxi]|uniref:hypothetical protein n=1 Tax=Niallia taxi TaxID=2499688 RepID=UPI0029341FB0|nr:hypothetical protein [Niallia taxi]WOD61784.1 hypothetical protein NQZ71_13260 [Niallia taxi]
MLLAEKMNCYEELKHLKLLEIIRTEFIFKHEEKYIEFLHGVLTDKKFENEYEELISDLKYAIYDEINYFTVSHEQIIKEIADFVFTKPISKEELKWI